MKRKSFLLAAATGVAFLAKPFTSSAMASKAKTASKANQYTVLSNGHGLAEHEGKYYLIGPTSLNVFDTDNLISLLKHRQIARIDPIELGRLDSIHERIALS